MKILSFCHSNHWIKFIFFTIELFKSITIFKLTTFPYSLSLSSRCFFLPSSLFLLPPCPNLSPQTIHSLPIHHHTSLAVELPTYLYIFSNLSHHNSFHTMLVYHTKFYIIVRETILPSRWSRHCRDRRISEIFLTSPTISVYTSPRVILDWGVYE